MGLDIRNKQGITPELRRHLNTYGAVTIPVQADPPVNAVEAAATIQAAIVATVMTVATNGTVEFEGETFTWDAAPTPADLEFETVAELAALFDDLGEWSAAGTTNVVVTADAGGEFWNGRVAVCSVLEDETAGGNAAGTEATATITAAAITAMAIGDTVEFDGVTFTRAAATDVGDREFLNAAGLADCIDDLVSWTGSASTLGVVTITAPDDALTWNDFPVVLRYRRATANGINGTPGIAGSITGDAGRIYLCLENAGFTNQGWRRIPVALEDF